MHGHGYAPPPPRRPSTGAVVTLRVILVALPLMTCGFLGWPATLRAALVTRRQREWWAFGASLAIWTFAIALMSTDNTDDFSSPNGTLGLVLMMLSGVACAIYFLIVDIHHYGQPMVMGNAPPQQTTLYGFQQAPPAPQPPAPQPYAGTPVPQPPPPQSAPAPPPPQRPAPVRIDQVRAELDELSDYLRKQEDDR
ncbi:hypothetical protein ACFYO0_23475 [Streptomyces sp. NPDC006365]|uniref:hypothetical protein n=1 Tax=Streptomyces sp. NPDC006365 TaxID=3364744 RepID=UPI0036A28A80